MSAIALSFSLASSVAAAQSPVAKAPGGPAPVRRMPDGRPDLQGQSVAAALLDAGERCLRIDEAGNPKGAVCGIGVCWECRCSIDGVPDTRACVTEARPGMIVRRQHGLNPCADP